MEDTWKDIIADWLSRGGTDFDAELTTQAIAWGALNIAPVRLGRAENVRIVEIMHELGYGRKKFWDSKRKSQHWGWEIDYLGALE